MTRAPAGGSVPDGKAGRHPVPLGELRGLSTFPRRGPG